MSHHQFRVQVHEEGKSMLRAFAEKRGWGCGFQISRRYIGILAFLVCKGTQERPSQEVSEV
jgi:hypothetical protein